MAASKPNSIRARQTTQTPASPLRGRLAVVAALVALLSLLADVVEAQDEAFSSRDLAPDPTWQATAGALGATGSSLSAGMGNPAAVAILALPEVAFSHLAWAGGLTREWAALGMPVREHAAFLFDAGILRTPELQSYDDEGNETGLLRVSEWNAGVTAAAGVVGPLQIGFGARLFRLDDPARPLTGIGLSGGLVLNGEQGALGISITDLGAPARGDAHEYRLPTRWRAGGEVRLERARCTGALTVEGSQVGVPRWLLGIAAHPVEWLELLGGVALDKVTGSALTSRSSGGVRLRQGHLAASYAFLPAGDLGGTHQFGLSMELAGRPPRSQAARP